MFLRARVCRGSDHGVKAQGEGWLLAVTLVSGEKLSPSVDTSTCDPYVVFTCNGKTRTSSVKLGTLNPEWHEVFEFDATEEAPSTMYIEVFDFEGPFLEGESLGYAEINFLKQSSEELADLWVQLEGKHAWSQESKLHLHICLTNIQESDSVTYYIQRVEKEVGKKEKYIWHYRFIGAIQTMLNMIQLPLQQPMIDMNLYSFLQHQTQRLLPVHQTFHNFLEQAHMNPYHQ